MKILLIVLGLVLLMVGYMIVKNNQSPDLGVIDGELKALGSKPNGVSSLTDQAEKLVDPLLFASDLATSKQLIKQACERYGDVEVKIESDNYLYLVFTTGKMKYKDDVEFYFDVNNQVIHFRSESRIGYSDMGLNRKRYDALAALYTELKEAN